MVHFIRLLFLSISLFNCFDSKAQYVYSDTISLNLTISPKQRDSMYLQLKEKGFPESSIQDIIESMSRNTSIQLIKGRNVIVRNDTSYVELNYSNTETEIFRLKSNKFIMVDGKLLTENTLTKEWKTAKVDDSMITFTPTGETRNILGIDCEEYISLDGVYKVWVNPKSKQSINPGIIHKNLPGAIWGFQVKKEQSFTRSELIKMPIQ